MTCPQCNGKTQVIHTRAKPDHVIRHRECLECGYMFRTIETDEDIHKRLQKGKTTDAFN